MIDLLEQYNNEQLKKLSKNKVIPTFRAGDTLTVKVQLENDRIQNITGLCIARRHRGLHSSFTIRKVNKNEGTVERSFRLHSPMIQEMKVIKYGIVRRAKLYYMRNLFGKAARIKERRVNIKKQ